VFLVLPPLARLVLLVLRSPYYNQWRSLPFGLLWRYQNSCGSDFRVAAGSLLNILGRIGGGSSPDTLRMTGFAVATSGRGQLLLKTPEGKIAQGEQKANTIFAFLSPLLFIAKRLGHFW
jgi:hypothetical protein